MDDKQPTQQAQEAATTADASKADTISDAAAIVARFLTDATAAPVHNFTGSDMDIWRLTAVATGPALRADDAAKLDGISIRYWYMHHVELGNRDTDDKTQTIRTAIIDWEGTVYAFVSAGVAMSIAALVSALGNGPYDKAVRVKVQEIRTRSGFRTLSLVPA
jgi:hypothetical protein